MNDEAVVDLAFPITPGHVPIDHGYALYSAISGALPELHQAEWLAIHPLGGRKLTASTLFLTPGSAVTLRLPVANVSRVLGLVGQTVRIHEHIFALGPPTLRPLRPLPQLFSWQVAVRLTRPPTRADGELDMAAFKVAFEEEATRQLRALGIQRPPNVLAKRVVRVKEQQTIAFSVELLELSPEESLLLQARGLGGKRRMGCGVFRGSREMVLTE